MIAPIDVQFIAGKDGTPEYAIIPFKVFQTLCNHKERAFNEKETIPHEVIKKIHLEDMNAIQAWREYLNLTQAETAKKNRKATLQKIAEAMNIDYLQLKI